ncbi:ATP-dependent Clp protease ATP-binding subunit ClpA CD4B [Helianthus anomalus]
MSEAKTEAGQEGPTVTEADILHIAIDLIDEAGSHVRLRHAQFMIYALQLPEEARELEKELRQITKEKNEAGCGQDFEKVLCLFL